MAQDAAIKFFHSRALLLLSAPMAFSSKFITIPTAPFPTACNPFCPANSLRSPKSAGK